jgi:hypothetical protein
LNESARSSQRAPRFSATDFEARLVDQLVEDPQVVLKSMRYFRGVDWEVVDDLTAVQACISAPSLFLCRREDRIFPPTAGRR